MRGAATAAKIPIIRTTTTSSTKLKADRLRALKICDVMFIFFSGPNEKQGYCQFTAKQLTVGSLGNGRIPIRTEETYVPISLGANLLIGKVFGFVKDYVLDIYICEC